MRSFYTEDTRDMKSGWACQACNHTKCVKYRDADQSRQEEEVFARTMDRRKELK